MPKAKRSTPKRSTKPANGLYGASRLRGLKPFEPGQVGNPRGRPKGSRNKLSETFLADLHHSWMKYGPEALRKVAREDPSTFCRVVAAMAPRHLEIEEQRALYVISDHPMTTEEWVAKYCDPPHAIEGSPAPVGI